MYFRISAVAFLIILTGSILLGAEVIMGEVKGTSLRAILICMSVAAIALLLNSSTRKGLMSGYGPFESEPLTFDTKFEDIHINGRISGNIAVA